MRSLLAVVLTLTFALTLIGCLESRDHVTLAKDGKGTVKSTYAVDLPKYKELMTAAAMLMGQQPPEGEIDMEKGPNALAPIWFELAAKGVEGYDITSATMKTKEGIRTTAIEARFDSLEAAAKGGAFFTSTVTLSKVDKSETVPTGAWKLTFKDALTGAGDAGGGMGGMDPAQMLPMFETQLKGLSIKRVLGLPTAILETNGKKAENGEEVEWTVTYDRILEGKDLEMSVVFAAAEELELKPFTYAADMTTLGRRMMEKPPVPKKAASEEGGEEKGAGDEPKPGDGEKESGDKPDDK